MTSGARDLAQAPSDYVLTILSRAFNQCKVDSTRRAIASEYAFSIYLGVYSHRLSKCSLSLDRLLAGLCVKRVGDCLLVDSHRHLDQLVWPIFVHVLRRKSSARSHAHRDAHEAPEPGFCFQGVLPARIVHSLDSPNRFIKRPIYVFVVAYRLGYL